MIYSLFGYWLPSLVGLPFLQRALPRSKAEPGPGSPEVRAGSAIAPARGREEPVKERLTDL